jgi:hypothetical protein
MITSLHPASIAAWSLGRTPPMANTFPIIVISPLMAMSFRRLHLEMEQATAIVANHGKAYHFADSRFSWHGDFLLAL